MQLNDSFYNQMWGLRLKTIRTQRKISRKEAAVKLDISVQQIRKYEEGISALSLHRLQHFAKLYKIPFSSLLLWLTESKGTAYPSSEEERMLALIRHFSPDARRALMTLLQQVLDTNTRF